MKLPKVSILVVNYNGKGLLEEMLPSVLGQSYPKDLYEVIVVDNNSEDDSVPFVRKNFPEVNLIESDQNLGFTGGNQLAFSAAGGDYIVMLNSDVVVDADWLKALVQAAEPEKVGLVSSRLRYYIPFLEFSVNSDVYPKSQLNRGIDHSPIGVMIEDVVCANSQDDGRVIYENGFYEKPPKYDGPKVTDGRATIVVPYDLKRKRSSYKITLHGPKEAEVPLQKVQILCGEEEFFNGVLSPYEVKQIDLVVEESRAKKHLIWLVQNAGNMVLRSGYGKDRGSISSQGDFENLHSYEQESEFFLKPTELICACGASCLVKRKVIDQIGFLDGYYFMYYEDMEFSLRAWRAGWKLMYEPKSIGYHRHRATTGRDETSFFLEHVERNHLAFLLTHFPMSTFYTELLMFLMRLLISGFWSFAFQFKDLVTAHKYKVRYLGRRAAFGFLKKSFFRLLIARRELANKWPINYKNLTSHLY